MATKSTPKGFTSIGKFTVTSGVLRVSDPCYEKSTWCSGTIDNALEGAWLAHVRYEDMKEWGKRVAELLVQAKGTDVTKWVKQKFEVGVDSGQAGIFDDKFYRDDAAIKKSDYGDYEFGDDSHFYSACCSHTLGKKHAGVLSFGAVSSSGFGDGSYTAYAGLDSKKQVVAVKVIFIDEEGA